MQHEAQECYIAFSQLGVSEYKWDWEGKLVDESVIERLLSEYHGYFKKYPLGKRKFLTFRLPNPKVETEHRLGRAFMGIVSASALAKHVGYEANPLFEVILPMTTSAEDMIDVQQAFRELASLKHPLLKHEYNTISHIELIPLFEQIDTIARSDKILKRYIQLHQKLFGAFPSYLRPYVARSDPALNSGMVPTVLAIKIALSRFRAFEEKEGVSLFPIIGAGSLPFRGGLTPETVESFSKEYRGVRTTTIQSAFMYDYPKKDVKYAVGYLEKNLSMSNAVSVSKEDEEMLLKIMEVFENAYQEVIPDVEKVVNTIAYFVPKRRERVQHVGLFGYSRGMGKIKLPRAIVYTASLYSLGIPPELIGTGRGLKRIKNLGYLPFLEKHYRNLKADLAKAGAFLNRKNLKQLSQKAPAWKSIEHDIADIENYLGFELGPHIKEEKEHEKVSRKIFQRLESKRSLEALIVEAALLRKSLG